MHAADERARLVTRPELAQQERQDHLVVRLDHADRREQWAQLGREREHVVAPDVMEWLQTDAIARAEQSRAAPVPEREREIAEQPDRKLVTEASVGAQHAGF